MPSFDLTRLLSFCGLAFVLHALTTTAASLEPRATVVPAPISYAPNEYWDGIDGQWSSFDIRVGTPAQVLRVFPSWMSYNTWVIAPEGCPYTANSSDWKACYESRGHLFNSNQSSTWDYRGLYSLWIEQNLGYEGNAHFADDTVGLGLAGSGLPTLDNMTVGSLAVYDFYLGVFGLNPKPTNWTTFTDSTPSFMTTLKQNKQIPSVSFGFTGGAPYRFTGVLASLTLGGYDASRFTPNNVEFVFAQDNERDLVVGIQTITTTSSNGTGTTDLLPNPVYALIDNTVPEIWLPIEACQAFEQEFGLVYDNTTELYIVNNTLHNGLLARNANISITLGQATGGGNTVTITMPYAAFDLTAKSPYRGLLNSTTYFPLRRAANATQYTLGRTFMQEAYISVDYERVRFNVSQVNWEQNYTPHLVAIAAASDEESSNYSGNTAHPSSSSSSKLSGGAIAGIVVGAVVVVCAVIGLAVWYFRRSKKHAFEKTGQEEEAAGAGKPTDSVSSSDRSTEKGTQVIPKAELDGSSPLESETKGLLHAPQTPTSPSSQGYSTYNSSTGTWVMSPMSPTQASEADAGLGAQIFEMPGDMPTLREADGKQITEKDMMRRREEQYNGVDPSTPTADTPTTEAPPTTRRMLEPSQVQEVGGRERQFSFSKDDDAELSGHGSGSASENATNGSSENATHGSASTAQNSTGVL